MKLYSFVHLSVIVRNLSRLSESFFIISFIHYLLVQYAFIPSFSFHASNLLSNCEPSYFIHMNMHSSVKPFIRQTIHLFNHSYIHRSVLPNIHSCIQTFIHPTIHVSLLSCIQTFIHPSIHVSILSCIQTFIHVSDQLCIYPSNF